MLKLAQDTFKNTNNKEYNNLLTIATEEINKAAEKGLYRVNIQKDINDLVSSDVKIALKYYLQSLGYEIYIDTGFIILWNRPI